MHHFRSDFDLYCNVSFYTTKNILYTRINREEEKREGKRERERNRVVCPTNRQMSLLTKSDKNQCTQVLKYSKQKKTYIRSIVVFKNMLQTDRQKQSIIISRL